MSESKRCLPGTSRYTPTKGREVIFNSWVESKTSRRQQDQQQDAAGLIASWSLTWGEITEIVWQGEDVHEPRDINAA
jgi:hypothetical protein